MEFQSGAVSPVDSISQGWNLIKDNYWIFFGMTLVAFILIIIAALVLGGIETAISHIIATTLGFAIQDAGTAVRTSAVIGSQLISAFISIFTQIIVATLSGVLFCGIYRALARTASGEGTDFGDLFSGFSKILPCLIVAVILSAIQFVITVISILVFVGIGGAAIGTGLITSDGQLNPALIGGILVGVIVLYFFILIVNLIISTLTAFVYPLIGVRELSSGQALMMSIKSGFSNFFGLILLLILLGLMSFGGILLCGIGFFFVAPILSASIFMAFQNVFGSVSNSRESSPPPPPSFGEQPGY